jgi:hypothetical protein
MTTIPQLRHDLAREQRAKLDAIAERDEAREAVKALRAELAEEKRRKPLPCPEQVKTIKALQSQLAKFAKYDMTRFKKWCQMVDAARGHDA